MGGTSVRLRRRRGTAEIELMLVIPVLLTMLFLAGANLTLGGARIKNVFNAESNAYHDATVASDPALAGDGALPPTDGLTALPDGLPNRVHLAQPQVTPTLATNGAGQPTASVTLTDRSAFIAPDWGYSGYPVADDGATIAGWFTDYAEEARGPFDQPLGLSAPTPP